jgi:hypothetical protein
VIELVAQISDHMNTGLHNAGYPRLTPLLDGQPGRIVVGNRWQHDQLVPPRVVMIPTKSTFDARTTSRGPANVADNKTRMDAQSKFAVANRTILTELATFEVAAWSLAPDDLTDSGAADFDYTRALYMQLVASCHALMPGCFTVDGGVWRATQHLQRVGREFVFSLTIALPILLEIPPTELAPPGAVAGLVYAPDNTVADISDVMVGLMGATGPGCE